MRKLMIAAGVLIGLVLSVLLVIMLASELGGEVVTIRTIDAGGEVSETRVWIVEHEGASWLRAGQDGSGWLVRLEARPEIEVERGGQWARYRAVPFRDPAVRDRIHQLMAEQYGFADRVIGWMRDPALSVPVRLEPV